MIGSEMGRSRAILNVVVSLKVGQVVRAGWSKGHQFAKTNTAKVGRFEMLGGGKVRFLNAWLHTDGSGHSHETPHHLRDISSFLSPCEGQPQEIEN